MASNSSIEQMILLESYSSQSHTKQCSFCPSDLSDVIEDTASGYFVCRNCGSIEDKYVISDSAEWRSFTEGRDNGTDPNRGGDVISSLEGTLAGNIMTNDGGALYDTISRSNRALSGRKDKHNQDALQIIGDLAARVAANTNIQNDCTRIWQAVDASGDLNGRPMEAIITACMLAALKQNQAGRSIREIKQYVGVSIHDIKKCWLKVVNHAKTINKNLNSGVISNTDGSQYLSRFCAQLKLPTTVLNAAIHIAKHCKELVEGKTPMTIAATSLFIACQLNPQEKRKIDDVAAVAGINADTIRKCFRDLHPSRESFIPNTYAPELIQKLSL